MTTSTILQGDVREVLPTLDAGSVQCVVTSPPYWGLRDYGVKGQIGLEPTPEKYVTTMVEVFREVRRVLRDDGTVWLNLGDSYSSSGGMTSDYGPNAQCGNTLAQVDPRTKSGARKMENLPPKNLVGIPWRVAFALQADGWYLRSDIIWAKGVSFCPNYSGSVMPEPVTDRPTKSHEYLFLLTTSPRYYYDADAVREKGKDWTKGGPGVGIKETQHYGAKNGRNLRSVWTINTQSYSAAHFATFPTALVEPCVKAGTSVKGCCSACGSPMRREVERIGGPSTKAARQKMIDKNTARGLTLGNTAIQYSTAIAQSRGAYKKTIRWKHSCNCGTDKVTPCVVLDPFAGSGTVGCVALKLGRTFVGIELNPEYCTLARNSIDGPLFAQDTR